MLIRRTTVLKERLLYNAILLFAICLHGLPAHAELPVVAVIDIAHEGCLSNRQRRSLSAAIRAKVARSATACKVLSSKRMSALKRRYRRDMASCDDNCDVALGELIGADYVVSGHVEESSVGYIGKLELRSTGNGDLVSKRERESTGFGQLKRHLLAAVPDLVAPLGRVVLQATDDEGPTEGPTEDPEALIAVVKEDEKPTIVELPPDRWDIAIEKPPLFETQTGEFAGIGLSVEINTGYSFILSRSSNINRAYTPLYHLGIAVAYQLFPFFQLALVGDFEHLRGETIATEEFVQREYNSFKDEYTPQTEIVSTFNNYWMIGVRPTFRFNVLIKFVELLLGVGPGFLYSSTSGMWNKHADVSIPDPTATNRQLTFTQDAGYTFTQTSYGFYTVFEGAVVFRVLEQRLGIGALVLFTVPSMASKGQKPKTKVAWDSQGEFEEDSQSDPDDEFIDDTTDRPIEDANSNPRLFLTDKNDFQNTVIRNLGSIYLLTVGLKIDFRF